jgi:hypothetical protein
VQIDHFKFPSYKVKLSRYCHAADKGERRYSSYSFVTSALDGVSGQRHALAALNPRERTPDNHCTGGWVSLRAALNTEARGKIYVYLGLNPGRPVIQSAVRHYTDWTTPDRGISLMYNCKSKTHTSYIHTSCVTCAVSSGRDTGLPLHPPLVASGYGTPAAACGSPYCYVTCSAWVAHAASRKWKLNNAW